MMFPEGTEDSDSKIVMPGDNIEMQCELHTPRAVEAGLRFNVREGGKTVATGLITKILA